MDVSQGAVVGVLGPWGSGKTSLVNLTRDEFEAAGVTILDFNPWMFSGAEQLVDSFFVELAAQLKIRPGLAEVGKDLEEYGQTFSGMAWLPLVCPWIERGRGAVKIVAKVLQRRKEGVGGRRVKLASALALLPKPIVVVLDDIDRLSTPEIRDVFRLVRLTASFPNIVYLVAFDRARVEKALAEQGVPGREYLEKILQVAVDLPAIPPAVLDRQIFAAIETALTGIETPGRFDKDAWPDLFVEIVRPLIRNMRDVRRYAAAIHGTVKGLRGQIALGDVLALEAVRVFLPDVFERLHSAVASLTTVESMGARREESPQLKAQVEGLLAAGGVRADVVRDMIARLFPAGRRHLGGTRYGADFKARWLREYRVAHEDFLRLYLERVAGESLRAFRDAELAWSRMADRDALETYLRSLDSTRLEEVISALETYQDQFASIHVVPAGSVLLNLRPDLPERQRGMFELDTSLVVGRVVYRLLRSLDNPAAVEATVRQMLPLLTSPSAKYQLLNLVGYREGAGHKLVSETAAAGFEKALRSEVRDMSIEDLVKEQDLPQLLLALKRDSDSSEPPFAPSDAPRMTLAILRAARGDTRRQSIDSRAVRRSPRLAWEFLIEIFGDEATLRERLAGLKAANLTGADDLLPLVEKYLGGWRPGAFGDDE